MKTKTRKSYAIVSVALFLSSCATDTIVMKKDYDFSQIKRVAVVEFRNSAYYPNSGAMVSQLFAKYLLKAGYNIVERDELDAILRERNLSVSDLINPDHTKKYGRISGIDAIVTGSIPMIVPERDFYENGSPRFIAAQVGVTARMISVETGEVLWIGSDTYDAMNTQTAFEYLISSLIDKLVKSMNENSPTTRADN
ncbi:MAG: hypothetical protein JW803_06230 [Endomicrobiales bacterium]|nr:hypothetical protein [Endomicrobiales bacterium]